MQLDQQIRVNELLLQREELFLRIHAAEAEIARLLRGPFPFTRPALPSDRRGKRRNAGTSSAASVADFFASAATSPSASPAASGASPSAPETPVLRRLAEDEAAYRITYLQFGRELSETHPDFTAVATLLASQAAHLRVLKVETVDAAGETRTLVFEAASAD